MQTSRDELETGARSPSASVQFLAGARDILPLLVGVIPFGMIYGAAAVGTGVSREAAQGMSLIMFGGSAQFIAAQLIGASAPAIVIVATVFIVNLRHALYSASVAPYLERLSQPWKWVLAYLLTDEAYVTSITHYARHPGETNRHWYQLGAGLALWLSWQVSSAVGIFVGARIPSSWPLDFALPVTFIALVVPSLQDRGSAAAALVAGSVAVLGFGLPYQLGLMLAALVGIAAGLAVERQAA